MMKEAATDPMMMAVEDIRDALLEQQKHITRIATPTEVQIAAAELQAHRTIEVLADLYMQFNGEEMLPARDNDFLKQRWLEQQIVSLVNVAACAPRHIDLADLKNQMQGLTQRIASLETRERRVLPDVALARKNANNRRIDQLALLVEQPSVHVATPANAQGRAATPEGQDRDFFTDH